MTEKERIAKWFLDNFRVHTDWTGDWVETKDHKSSVKEVIDDFMRSVYNKNNY